MYGSTPTQKPPLEEIYKRTLSVLVFLLISILIGWKMLESILLRLMTSVAMLMLISISDTLKNVLLPMHSLIFLFVISYLEPTLNYSLQNLPKIMFIFLSPHLRKDKLNGRISVEILNWELPIMDLITKCSDIVSNQIKLI